MVSIVLTTNSITLALWTQSQLAKARSNIGELRGRGVVLGWRRLDWVGTSGLPAFRQPIFG